MPLRLLEHVILKITDADVARSFYSALGAVVSPVNSDDESSLDVNVGASQVRLCLQPCGGDAVLSWPGCISVWSCEELGNVWARVQTLAASHAACSPGCWHTSANLSSSDAVDCTLCVTCPWGNKFLIKRAPEGLTDDPEGARPGGTGTLISLTSLEHFVRPGAAAPLHAFWSRTFGADAASLKGMHDDARIQQCRVHMISGQRLLFTESPNAPLVADSAGDDATGGCFRVALCLDTLVSFDDAFRSCAAAGALESNAELDRASEVGLFRIVDMGSIQQRAATRLGQRARPAGLPALDLSSGMGIPVAGSAMAPPPLPPPPVCGLVVEVRSVAHSGCPLTREARVAGGAAVEAAAGLADWPALRPLPFADRGIPHSAGSFGAAAIELASMRGKLSKSRRSSGAAGQRSGSSATATNGVVRNGVPPSPGGVSAAHRVNTPTRSPIRKPRTREHGSAARPRR